MKSETYYLIGALGDGCLSTEYTVVYIQKCKEWLTEAIIPEIDNSFGKKFNAEKLYFRDGAWRLKFKNKDIWKTLKSLRNEVPQNDEAIKFYIRGFWDAEGSCSSLKRSKKKPFINFTQKNKETLSELKKLLNDMKIKTGEVRISDKKKNVWRLWIENTEGIIRFCEEIGSLHPEKKIKLNNLNQLLLSR